MGGMGSIQVVWMYISVKQGDIGELRCSFYFSCAHESQLIFFDDADIGFIYFALWC